jgi:hypothetical protein
MNATKQKQPRSGHATRVSYGLGLAAALGLLTHATLSVASASASFEAQPLDDRPAPPPGGHHGPPPEAIEACNGKAAEEACTVTLRDGVAHAGTCQTGPDGKGQLACRPNDLPKPPAPPGE